MTTEERRRDQRFWSLLSSGGRIVRPRQEWESMIGTSGVAELVASGVASSIGKDALTGNIFSYDFGFCAQEYELEQDGEKWFAVPVGPGDRLLVSFPQVDVLALSRSNLVSFLAARNGFTHVEGRTATALELVGRLFLGRDVFWCVCFSQEKMNDAGVIALLKEYASGDSLVVVSLPDPAQSFPRELVEHGRIIPMVNPSPLSGWQLDRLSFCRARYGFQSKDVALQLYRHAKKRLVIDEEGGAIYWQGQELLTRRANKEFQYVAGLAKNPGSETDLELFSRNVLKHPAKHDLRTPVYEVRRQLKERIERITDPESRADALSSLHGDPAPGKLLIDLDRKEVHFWAKA